MRTSTFAKVLLLGAAGAYWLHRARKSPAGRVRSLGTVPPPDPDDLVQNLFSESDTSLEIDAPAEGSEDALDFAVRDTGDLYGVHVSASERRSHLDADAAMDEGQSWIEALQTDAIEGGVLPEHEVEIAEDEEIRRAGHSTDTKDTPVADYGSGGRAGY